MSFTASQLACGTFPPAILDSVYHADEEAMRVRDEMDWLLAAFIALFDEDLSHVLLVQLGDYAKARYGGNPWTLPGGSVLPGERPSEGVKREVQEEVGAFIDVGSLRLAGWFPRPYHQPYNRNRAGELLLLFAAVGHLDDSGLRAAPPETLSCTYYPYNFESFLAVPSQGSGDHPLQPLPRHWAYWAECGFRQIAQQLTLPCVHVYQSAEDMTLPPWSTSRPNDIVIATDSGATQTLLKRE